MTSIIGRDQQRSKVQLACQEAMVGGLIADEVLSILVHSHVGFNDLTKQGGGTRAALSTML